MTAPIDFYFDPVSPFSYLASTQIDAIAQRHGRSVNWKPLLVGVTVINVMGLKPIPDTPLKSTYAWLDASRTAQMLGVPLNRHGRGRVNSVAACRAFLWLKQADPEMARKFALTISALLWVDSVDITDPETVVAEAAALGANAGALRDALQTPELKQMLADEVDAAIAREIFGVPFFIVDDHRLWGCDRLWMLEFWLAHGRWPTVADWTRF